MITIGPMTAAQVPEVAALEKKCFSMPWSERSIAEELENELSLWLTAVEDGKVAGYIGSQTTVDGSDVMNVGVDPEKRQRGIGKQLLSALGEALHARGSGSMTLEVRPSNAPARALYAWYGFREIGRRKKYYVNPTEDALILRKEW